MPPMMFHVKHSSIVSGLLRRITLRADLAVARSPAGRVTQRGHTGYTGLWPPSGTTHTVWEPPLAAHRCTADVVRFGPHSRPASMFHVKHGGRDTRIASTLASPGQKPRTLRLIGSPRVNRAFGGGLWHLGLTFGAVSNHNLPPVHRLRVQPLSHVCSTTAMAAPRE